ncbi:MAG: serine hydrolase [Lachnospiraceae bacterium]|nr:serine hydrolase [Lachnospiraceae bacterium]MDY4970290.1 D-alanyl-D-alanine carboxypeptidase [Lachnospiraceae bacterium]
MSKLRKTAFLLAVSVMLTGCGFGGKEVLLPNHHQLTEDAQAVSSLTSGKQAWAGSELCIPADSSVYKDEEISAGAALLFNLDRPEVLYANNVYQKMNPASLTTLFTAYVVLQNKNLSDAVTVRADELAGLAHTSTIGLKAGDQVTIEQLLYGMLLCSGVDAANVLAVETAGDKPAFVRMMNRAAEECGCVDTQFQNPNGLTEQGHYTTAYDIYLVIRKLMEDQRFVDIISSGTYKAVYKNAEGEKCEENYTSTVQYAEEGVSRIGSVQIIGGKTGTTSSAGHCLALIGTDSSGEQYLTVVLKAKSRDSLYEQIEHIVKKIEK